jgi:hypothetical protein
MVENMPRRNRKSPDLEPRLAVPENPLGSAARMGNFLLSQRTNNVPSLRARPVDIKANVTLRQPLSMHHQIRHGLLPAVARRAGLEAKSGEILSVFDAVVGDDLRYDLRLGSPLPSGASGALSPFLMNMSFGAGQDSAVRYQCEPMVQKRALGGRSAAFKARLKAVRALGLGRHAFDKVMAAWVAAVPYEAMALDNIRPSLGVRHYAHKPPDVSAYFVLEAPDPAYGHQAVQRALEAMGEPELWEQIQEFDKATFKERGYGILALDCAADGSFEVKLYKRSERITRPQVKKVMAKVEATEEGVKLFERFKKTFVPPYVKILLGGIGFVLDRGGRPPAFKIYLDTSMMYDDAEAVRRLEAWLTEVGFSDGMKVFRDMRAVLAPERILEGVGNFMDMVSLDVGARGLFKTSLYYAPEVSLTRLAQKDPRLLPTWDGALSWDAAG